MQKKNNNNKSKVINQKYKYVCVCCYLHTKNAAAKMNPSR